jgi:hypothetical protein
MRSSRSTKRSPRTATPLSAKSRKRRGTRRSRPPPWLVGGDRKRKVPADQLFETLKPFKDRVADDIKD